MSEEIYHDRLEKLRTILQENQLGGFILSTHDPFFSEYPPEHFQRLKWLTGFSGSAGTVIVLKDKAHFFTDGRYTLQARKELSPSDYEIHDIQELNPLQWLEKFPRELTIGFDSWLASLQQHRLWQRQNPAIRWQALDSNPLDIFWQDRPALSSAPAFEHLYEYAGKTREKKVSQIATAMRKAGAKSLLLCLPESICWLLNIRARDMHYTPLLLCRALLHDDETVELFAPEDKIGPDLFTRWQGVVTLNHPENLLQRCRQLAEVGIKIMADPVSTPYALAQHLEPALVEKPDPCLLPKARKNQTEWINIANTHLTDGLALQRFFHWLREELAAGTALTEWDASEKLDQFRAESPDFVEPSFPTISGFGPNGAIVHYRVQKETALPLTGDGLFLLDSGGQYPGGTTDVTRTIAIGTPNQSMKAHFTQVLKGHIALANIVFPKGTKGAQLDVLARQYLWQNGLDYAHGTGHGVGCFLGVHEGPQSISKRPTDAALEPGMILSNEPGYYEEGEYGIRIENLVLVAGCDSHKNARQYGFSLYDTPPYRTLPDREDFMYFRTLTCAPLDESLICNEMLSQAEKDWVTHYQQWVTTELAKIA